MSYTSRKDRADIYFHKSTVHDIHNLKAVCDSSAVGATSKAAEPLARLSPTDLKDPVAVSHLAPPSLLHDELGANYDSLHGSFSPQSHSSSQTSIHTEVFSPTPTHVDAAAVTTPSVLGHESCHSFDQERRSSSGSSTLNLSSHAEAVSNTTSSSLGDESCQIFDQERCSRSCPSLSLPSTSSLWPAEDTTQMPLDYHEHYAPITPSDINEMAADDSTMSTLYDWADLPIDLFQPAPSNSYGGSNRTADLPIDLLQPVPSSSCSGSKATADLPMNLLQSAASSTYGGSSATADVPMDLLQPAPSSTHGVSNAMADLPIYLLRPAPSIGSNTTTKDDLEKIILPNNDSMSSSNNPSSQSGAGHEPQNDLRLGAKRMKKLDALLEMLQTASLPSVTEHNEIVNEMRRLCRKGSFHRRRVASGSFSADLEEPTASSSSAAKFVHDLLSWEKFRQEEKRLMQEEDLSSISASKEVNARMMKARRRHSKTRDWASDGRKAAKMFFDALHNRDTADRSFALLLLASNVSLDQMLKIAHFPALRSSFASRFARIVEKKAEEWSTMSGVGFAVLNVAQVVGD